MGQPTLDRMSQEGRQSGTFSVDSAVVIIHDVSTVVKLVISKMATSAEELTNCMICTEIFTDPQVLPCDHVFCKGCVNKLRNGGTVKCPKCCKVCVNDDVKSDFRLATFLDALATTTEKLTRLSSSSVITDDVTQQHVTPPAGDKCESCEENVIDSFCHQCQQWFCESCRKVHGLFSYLEQCYWTSYYSHNWKTC